MATDGYIELDGSEFINLARTVALADVLSIDTVWITQGSVQWISDTLDEDDYDDITKAPWYDPGAPESWEFAGLISLSMVGLDDDTLESATTEYVTDGGNSSKARNATLPIVASVAIIASTDRGADFGKRWLDRRLRSAHTASHCSGSTIRYFRYKPQPEEMVLVGEIPMAHRRNVSLSRGVSVTRKRSGDCSATWLVTYTWTCNDPFEYGDAVHAITSMGGGPATGPKVITSSSSIFVEQSCPEYDYTPIYDPLHPALVAPPVVPDFYPDGWDIFEGMTFDRFWAQIHTVEPTSLNTVPVITLTTTVAARMVRVQIWSDASGPSEQCDPLFTAIVTYLPNSVEFTIDGEQQASYVWDGFSPQVRRADSLVYGVAAVPVQWTSFNDVDSLYVTLDVFSDSSGYEGDGAVRLALDLVQKSD